MAKFINNCVESINKNFDNNLYEKVDSLNKTCFDKRLIENANIVIVGTLTPSNGMGFGYYYTSERNRVYKLLDYCFDKETNGLSDLKKELKQNPKDKTILQKIKEYLFEHKIVFVDVIDVAIRKKGSSLDDDIIEYTLDYNSFKHCKNSQKFVCTSKNAMLCLNKIQKFDNVVLCPQDRFRCKKEDWKKQISNQ